MNSSDELHKSKALTLPQSINNNLLQQTSWTRKLYFMLLNVLISTAKPAHGQKQLVNHEQRTDCMAGMVCNMDATDIWALPF